MAPDCASSVAQSPAARELRRLLRYAQLAHQIGDGPRAASGLAKRAGSTGRAARRSRAPVVSEFA
jgi:hypothetical protein